MGWPECNKSIECYSSKVLEAVKLNKTHRDQILLELIQKSSKKVRDIIGLIIY